MTAETVYNVIQALPDKERPRLLKMLGVSEVAPQSPKVKAPLLSDADATDRLLKALSKKKI